MEVLLWKERRWVEVKEGRGGGEGLEGGRGRCGLQGGEVGVEGEGR